MMSLFKYFRLMSVNFPKPDEYFHIFVGNDKYLKKYLNFLGELKNPPNE